jgi:hypothetical protein
MKLQDITYLKLNYGNPKYIFFDYNSDLSIDQTANVTENPIDATLGSSMQENRIVDLVTVGISGSFGERNKERVLHIKKSDILFTENKSSRLEIIVEWFEKALENNQLFTVCKKGVLYNNQLLNSIKFTLDESASKIDVSLSFIEVVMVERAEIEGSITTVIPSRSPGAGTGGGVGRNAFSAIETLV